MRSQAAIQEELKSKINGKCNKNLREYQASWGGGEIQLPLEEMN